MRVAVVVAIFAACTPSALALTHAATWNKQLAATRVTLHPSNVPPQPRRVSVDESLWGTHDPNGTKALSLLIWWPTGAGTSWFVGHSENLDVASPTAFALVKLSVQPRGGWMLITVRWHRLGETHIKQTVYRVSYNQDVNPRVVSNTR